MMSTVTGQKEQGGWEGSYTQPDQLSNAGVCLMRTSALYSLT